MIRRVRDLSIRTKVFAAFGLVFLVVLALGLLAISRLSALNDTAADIRDNWLPSTGLAGEMSSALEFRRGLARPLHPRTDRQRR